MRGWCDGCQRAFAKGLILINAKTWRTSVCDMPAAPPPGTGVCRRQDCEYNIEGVCIEYQFCDTCSRSQEIIDRAFEEFPA